MSCMYYRVEYEKPPSPRFGYKKVDQKEMQSILSRVTRPRSSQVNRPLSAVPRRRLNSSKHDRRYPTEQDWQRMIRRLQRTTLSRKLATEKGDNSQKTPSNGVRTRRPKSVKESSTRNLEKLCRPTTASMAKSILTCEGKDFRSNSTSFDPGFVEDKALPPEEVEAITERVRMPTYSSQPESRPCTRSDVKFTPDPMIQDIRLPLISGLDRSRNVGEIVDRLHQTRRKQHSPAATAITVYQT